MSRQMLLRKCGIVGLAIAIWSPSSSYRQWVADGQEVDQANTVRLPEVCGVRLKNPQISWYLPSDAEGELEQPNSNVVQRATDIFSWQEFVALNWPAQTGMRGEPDERRKISSTGPRVWETWKETDEVYLPKGIQPPAWNAPQRFPQQCSGTKVLSRRQKVDDEVDAVAQAAGANKTLPVTLTDQRGNLVRYEIRMNRVLFEYIVQRKLYNGDRQIRANSVSYPDGSMIIKASWRELLPEDEPRYVTVEACVCDKVNGRLTNCRTRKMGLVGLHMMQKTPSAPQWIWSTFEHVDNVKSDAGIHPSFFNPYCSDCKPNQQTQAGVPNQVTRVIPIPASDPDCEDQTAAVDNIQAINRAMQQALANEGSVLQFYELVNTQWPVPSRNANRLPATVFSAQPALLANTTMETFVQESSSCIGCHSMARTLRTDRFVSSDFSFTLNNAQPQPPNPKIIPQPNQPVTDWDKQHWNSILRGQQLTVQTYELLPQFVTAKLHCGSCHLNAGGNPTAAWWVGMMVKYAYPQTNNLQKRINGCFERSMNGRPICDPESPGECNSDPNMNALITYMQWLDEQYPATNPSGPMPNGFPAIPQKPPGEVDRGEAIFLQKCAFCHGPDGQGRYEDDVYYRPALWGPNSYNASAGMARPHTFAEFVKANMPHHSGGLLTDQEARDIAAFVDSQCRPGSP